MIKKSEWKTIERPGWFGENRDTRIAEYDAKYGAGNWRIRHILGPRILDFDEAVKLYEISYELHFMSPESRFLWSNLFKVAKEVWVEQESDADSGLDYHIQKTKAAHYEDVAIRRIGHKHGQRFKGDRLIRIRADSEDVLGIALSSVHVPFVFPRFIEAPLPEMYWWNRHGPTVENFWHTNKVLQVKEGGPV